eukprot:COSAG02_NODE_26649_length_628_cov_0.964083_2_plen_74_part_00
MFVSHYKKVYNKLRWLFLLFLFVVALCMALLLCSVSEIPRIGSRMYEERVAEHLAYLEYVHIYILHVALAMQM